MNRSKTEIDKWFIEGTLSSDEPSEPEVWDPIFDVDRQLVLTKLGPYSKLFLRPEGFVRRFYHQIYPLPVENWQIAHQVTLYDGFCTIDAVLEIRFQATLKYGLNNMDILSDINNHIKTAYQDLIINLVDKELLNLSDGAWVQTGVSDIEHKISLAVGEMLILQNIQSQVLCSLKPAFEDFPEVQLAKENVYLCVLKKSYEFNDAKRTELFRQEQEIERQKLEHQQQQIELLSREGELERLKQAQEALNKKLLLEERTKQLLEQFEIERRLHIEQVNHKNNLKEIRLEAELEEQKKHEERLRIAEQNTQMETLAHQAKLKAKELEAEIAKYEHQQARWRESKNKVHTQQLALEQRQKQQELEAELENQRRREQQRLQLKKENYKHRRESDVYLRREIELLEREKQHLQRQLTTKEAEKDNYTFQDED